MKDLPLNALRNLAAVSEAGGIRAAARLLGVSPSAVHRQIRELELRLGIPFTVPGQKFELSAAAERLARQAEEALAILDAGYSEIIEDRRPNSILLATSDSFASRWLVPRLPRLKRRHPQILVSLITDRGLVEVPRQANLAVRMGSGDWAGQICEPLMHDWILPAYCRSARSGTPDVTIEELLGMTLLHDRDPQANWRRWGATFGIEASRLRPGITIASSHLALLAAEHGLGVAMARWRLGADSFARQALVGLAQYALPIAASYWLVRPPTLRSVEQDFVSWMREEAEAAGDPPVP